MNRLAIAALTAFIGLAACQSNQSPTAIKQSASPAKNGVLRVAVEGNYPPFSFVDSSGTLTGFDVDFAKAACLQLQRKCDIVQIPFERFFAGLQAHEYDVIVSSMEITEARARYISFTDPYYRIPVYLAGRKGLPIKIASNGYVDAVSLAGLRIATRESTRTDDFARKMFPSATIATRSIDDALAASLKNDTADLIFEDRLVLGYEIGDQLDAEYQLYGAGYLAPELEPGVGIAVRKEDDELRQSFNAAIKAMRTDGTFHKIMIEYFSYPVFAE